MAVYKMFRGEVIARGKLDVFIPETVYSRNWKHWRAGLDLKTCEECRSQHGKVYTMDEVPNPAPPLHPNCRCTVEAMQAVEAGKASKEGENGADWWIKTWGILPDYYIGMQAIMDQGWFPGNSPVKYAPGKMVFGGVYHNKNKHLPEVPGRIWFEADLNYYSGKRNRHRVVWSSDGLMFVTYDHYNSFIEVNGG